MAKKIFYVSRTEDPSTGIAGAATLNRADQPQLIKVYDTVADVEADISNIDTNEIVGTKEVDLSSYTIVNRVAEGNLNPVTSNAVAGALSYSTDETPTGGHWIDGKPIYRKVIQFNNETSISADPGVDFTLTTLGLSDIDNIFSIYAFNTTGSKTEKRRFSPIASYWLNDTTLRLRATTTITSYYLGLIIEYTKTTD